MIPKLLVAATIMGFILTVIIDSLLHKRNILIQYHCGAYLVAQNLSRCFYVLIYTFFALALAEFLWGPWIFPKSYRHNGAIILFLGINLRLWAIYSLGEFWSRFCMVIPEAPKVRKGPYRWLAHPEYISRILEAVGLALLMNALGTMILLLPATIIIAIILARIEARQWERHKESPLANVHNG